VDELEKETKELRAIVQNLELELNLSRSIHSPPRLDGGPPPFAFGDVRGALAGSLFLLVMSVLLAAGVVTAGAWVLTTVGGPSLLFFGWKSVRIARGKEAERVYSDIESGGRTDATISVEK